MTDYSRWDRLQFNEQEESQLCETERLQTLLGHMNPDLMSSYECVKDKEIIMIGESTHGTLDFYEFRCALTRQLIESNQCTAVCIEGDWPTVALLHLFVTDQAPDLTLDSIMEDFQAFPSWVWANRPMHDFLLWLKQHNLTLPANKRCGIFGLDLHSLSTSFQSIISFLESREPATAAKVKEMCSCFDKFSGDPVAHGPSNCMELPNCRQNLVDALLLIANKTHIYARPRNGIDTQDLAFVNEMNARVARDAVDYYRSMFDMQQQSTAWEMRDQHHFDTLVRIRHHMRDTRGSDHVVVWAHNSHIGDDKFTHSNHSFNLGQLVKDAYAETAISIGQFCYTGEVTAARAWGEQEQVVKINEGLHRSYEDVFHAVSLKARQQNYCLDMRVPDVRNALNFRGQRRLQRAIGAIYRPDTELLSHYYPSEISRQFDVLVWMDDTKPLRLPVKATGKLGGMFSKLIRGR